jgi:hypothetical protein
MRPRSVERRRGRRAQVDLSAMAHVGGYWHDARAVDLSTSGFVLARQGTLRARPLPEVVAITVKLPDGRPVRARARAVWEEDDQTGLRFLGVSDVDRLRIAEYLDALERDGRKLH